MVINLLRILSINFFFTVAPILGGVAFLTLLERKLLRLIGFRTGPNKVSLIGFLQPIGDAVKLASKQVSSLTNFSFLFYYVGSGLCLLGALFLWYCYFVYPSLYSLKFLVLFFIVVLSLNSLRSVITGWRSFSKYSLIGSLRTVSQLISYEASLYVCLFFLFVSYFSFNYLDYRASLFPMLALGVPYCVLIWVPSFLAELNRTPYDFSEGERELVRGFNTEFGSKCFTLIFLSEYSNIIFFCAASSVLFFSPHSFEFFFFFFFF